MIHCFLLAGMSGTLWSGGSWDEAFGVLVHVIWIGSVGLG